MLRNGYIGFGLTVSIGFKTYEFHLTPLIWRLGWDLNKDSLWLGPFSFMIFDLEGKPIKGPWNQ